ncbi:MAG: hypothetical protein FWD29_06220 [Micrococcales bacterium]|nr:hypothetical protein [Micrococcales bacterium]
MGYGPSGVLPPGGGYSPPGPIAGYGLGQPQQPAPKRSWAMITLVTAAAVVLVAAGVVFGVPSFREKALGLFSSNSTPTGQSSRSGTGADGALTVINPIPLDQRDGSIDDSAVPPAGFMECSSGMEPVSWTSFSGGQLLICGSRGGDFEVMAKDDGGQTLSATVLTFTSSGCEVEFSDGSVMSVFLGGAVVTVAPSSGDSVTQVASQAWDQRTGSISAEQVPATGIQPCPSGSWPISLAGWQSGWLRVCGTGPDQASHLAYEDDRLGEGAASAIENNGDGYCATLDSGTVTCVYRSPAVVTFTDRTGRVDQRSVMVNAFAGQSSGGAGLGTGAYGVQAPEDTDQDQVRYLVEILEKSSTARAKLGPAVSAAAACENLSGQIATISSVADNRQELLDALRSTPVDQIPGGIELVSQLTRALDASLGADLAYLDWAQAKQDSGCAPGAGKGDYDRAAGFDTVATEAKKAFVENWNTNIAPRYRVSTFEEPQI